MIKTMWLTLVQVAEGMFPTERMVQLRTADGTDLSLFVPVSTLREEPGRELLRVAVLESDDRFSLVQLPGEGSVAKVQRAQLEDGK